MQGVLAVRSIAHGDSGRCRRPMEDRLFAEVRRYACGTKPLCAEGLPKQG